MQTSGVSHNLIFHVDVLTFNLRFEEDEESARNLHVIDIFHSNAPNGQVKLQSAHYNSSVNLHSTLYLDSTAISIGIEFSQP